MMASVVLKVLNQPNHAPGARYPEYTGSDRDRQAVPLKMTASPNCLTHQNLGYH